MHIARVTPLAIPTLASVEPPRPVPPIASRGVWLTWLENVLARRAERRQLLALEERELRDIGLTPAEALALAQQPIWHR